WGVRFFDGRSLDNSISDLLRKTALELDPKFLVRPFGNVGVAITLNVVAAQPRIALWSQRQATAVMCIHNLLERRRFRHDAEPTERVGALESSLHRGWNIAPGYAVEAIAACNDLTVEALLNSAMFERHIRLLTVNIMEFDALGLIDHLAAIANPDAVQFLCYGRLAEGHHLLAGKPHGIDQEKRPIFPGD